MHKKVVNFFLNYFFLFLLPSDYNTRNTGLNRFSSERATKKDTVTDLERKRVLILTGDEGASEVRRGASGAEREARNEAGGVKGG